MAEWFAFANALVDRAMAHAEDDPQRLAALADGLASVSPTDRDRIIAFLEERCAAGELNDEGALQLWEKLHALVARHERFAEADWAMPEETRARLGKLVAALEPQGNPERFAYLFDWHPDLPGVDATDFERYAATLSELQSDAIRSVLALPDNLDRLAALARRSPAPSQLGGALAGHDDIELVQILPWFESTDLALREAAASWVHRRLIVGRADWLETALRAPGVEGAAREVLLLNIPPAADNWLLLHKSPNQDDESYYWTTARVEVVPLEDTAQAIEKLIAHGRAWSAIAVAAQALDQNERRGDQEKPLKLTQAEIIHILQQALEQEVTNNGLAQMRGYYLGKLLDHLTSTGAQANVIARFEFQFFRLLEHYRQPTVLNSLLATDPNFFVELVKRAYRGKNEPRRQAADADRNMSMQAWHVLRSWKGYPGRQDDGSMDCEIMHDWVRTARLALSEADRADIGDELVGQAFAYSPVGADGAWPAEPVRDLIETIGSRELENGFIIGRISSRGVTTRGIYDGGKQERELAQQYRQWSTATQAEWRRTSRILRTLAESYEQDARREDLEAELDADQYWN
jgi:hypothetical protein